MSIQEQNNVTPAESTYSDEDNEALAAEMERLDDDGNLVEEEAAAEETEEEPAEESEEEDDSEEDDSEEDEDDSEEESEEEETQSEDKPDEIAAKRIADIQTEEKRAKAAVAEERATFKAAQDEWAPRVKAAEDFEALRARAAEDPVGALLGLVGDDVDHNHVSKQFYLMGKGKDDPKFKEQAAEQARMRSNTAENASLRKRVEAMEKDRADEKLATQQREAVNTFLDTTLENVNGKTPLVTAMLAADPGGARDELLAAAQRVGEREQRDPTSDEVLAEMEKDQTRLLKRLGIEPPTAGPKAVKKTKPKKAKKTKAVAKTNNSPAAVEDLAEIPSREDMLEDDGWPT